ncbi:MAG: hypothetical protein HYW51_01105 [Candidatus Doudnabacteria bacterium]|nr:hypothetical protein [Candidatus Doudnabacteria bacterium]
MRILSETRREELVKQFGSHRDFKYFGKSYKHCYLAALTKEEYENLGMNSSPENPFPEKGYFPKMKESVAQFLQHPKYLEKSHPDRGISGITVKRYLQEFQKGLKLRDCFITDDVPANAYYICEGMHRLTAYGVFKELDIKDYDVQVYYHTNKNFN